MFRQNWMSILVLVVAAGDAISIAEDLATTRPSMKQQLEALKHRQSRLPLPPPTEQDRASGRMLVNNGRLRSIYLPPSWQSFLVPGWGSSARRLPAGGTQALLKSLEADPNYAFKTRLFWIVSRTNDCQYCLGHQELKLKRVGMTDDQIALLDFRWDSFPESEQVAMRVSRKLTISPHLFGDREIAELRTEYDDAQIIDILYTVARYNAVNRWTSSTGIPQDQSFGSEEPSALDTPTSAEFVNVTSKVTPTDWKARQDWEPREQAENAIQGAQSRTPSVAIPSMDVARRVLAADTPGVTPPVWFQAIATLPIALDAWTQRQAIVRDGKTPIELRAQIAWVTARENRAWYAAGHARARYLAMKGDEAALYSFSTLEKSVPASHAEALRFARKLTSSPHAIEDEDVSRLKEHFSDEEVAEIIHLACDANGFDRFTEALRLPLEL